MLKTNQHRCIRRFWQLEGAYAIPATERGEGCDIKQRLDVEFMVLCTFVNGPLLYFINPVTQELEAQSEYRQTLDTVILTSSYAIRGPENIRLDMGNVC